MIVHLCITQIPQFWWLPPFFSLRVLSAGSSRQREPLRVVSTELCYASSPPSFRGDSTASKMVSFLKNRRASSRNCAHCLGISSLPE